jgi:hypothetical protein
VGDIWNQRIADLAIFVLCSAPQPLGADVAKKRQEYKITVAGPGHNFERSVDEAIAGQILALIMTGAAAPASSSGFPGHISAKGGGSSPPTPATKMSLAAFIKAKKGDKNQNTRFLATASWLSGRSEEPLTAKAIGNALSDHHQKGLANAADCLNQNVRKGFCEKRKDGTFFITPEGLEALDGPAAE